MQERFLAELTEGELTALPWLFEFWAMEHQLPPEGDWRSWVILGGRGAGKTRAGAEWVRSMVEGARPLDPGVSKRMALVGETLDQVREVMIFGESGILACSPPDRRPEWESTRKRLVWPNGAVAQAFSAHDPESLRGPQFDAAWVDELAKWRRGEEAWDMLQFCLRLGDRPRQCVTTTPRNVPVLKRLLEAESTVRTHAATQVNKANLAASFLEEVERRYGGSRLGLQELDGRLLEDVEGALWTSSQLSGCRGGTGALSRVVVAVDPPVTGGANSDTCGIVVAGLTVDGERAVVIEDASVKGSPLEWAQAAVAAYHRHGADRVVAEVNQGGELVEAILRQVDRTVSYRGVYASRGKVSRAEPVAALYEQGRVAHRGRMDELEAQMVQMAVGGFRGAGSPDRVDALVWALTELMLGRTMRPGVRGL
ncbi:Large terminase phage packaging protein [Palleronia marisminoris]|uniref:Terminase-like family protein n=1 Tax=Palleronia marisminoris TaxID=315423 RepID=A0A1Y5RGN7_9RHOB|nr:Large terminase phage packaging protein [Palleronia marisminoris]SLN17024.1 Terminase-like family protein [Palleronia marisminoris]